MLSILARLQAKRPDVFPTSVSSLLPCFEAANASDGKAAAAIERQMLRDPKPKFRISGRDVPLQLRRYLSRKS
jgi:hypothetical protein